MKYFNIFFVMGLFFNSCDTSQLECIRVSDNIITEVRELKDFDGVVFNHVGDLILTQGPEYSFSIKGPDNVLELTNTFIENGLLVVGTNDCFNGSYNLEIKITSPLFNTIKLAGQGNITTNGPINSDIMEIEMLGVGGIDANIFADTLYTSISGTGNIKYEGLVNKHQIVSSGEFTLSSFLMVSEHTIISLSGIGDCEVTANKSLNVTISGEGNVLYKGTPSIESNISGKGEIINDN